MINHGTGWVRLEYAVPARGLIGFRTEFLTETRGTGIMHHVFEATSRGRASCAPAPTGSLVADRTGVDDLVRPVQPAGTRSAVRRPGHEVYEGMIVGENPRTEDMDINPTKEKKLTNVRSSTGEELERLVPPRLLRWSRRWSSAARTSASR